MRHLTPAEGCSTILHKFPKTKYFEDDGGGGHQNVDKRLKGTDSRPNLQSKHSQRNNQT
jgi:hypothetical protein